MNKQSGWISVDEQLPTSPAWVLVYANGAMNCMFFYNNEWQDPTIAKAHNIDISSISHWMPLPEPPDGE